MKPLPERPHPEHLKKQAKQLLADCRHGEADALARFRAFLPAAKGREDTAITAMKLRLHDAQSCLAREYGFVSWTDLMRCVEVIRDSDSDAAALAAAFCRLVYAGDVAGGMNCYRPSAAARLLQRHPDIATHDPWVACAAGNIELITQQNRDDPGWVNRTGGPLRLTPLIAVTHSGLLQVPDFRDRLRDAVGLLLDAGADPAVTVGSRWGASLETESTDHRLSALYGAAGVNHDALLVRRLLTAGADPDDGESLYHSLESPDCTALLLQAGATVTGTNALFRVLDLGDLGTLKLLLSHAGDAPELKGSKLLFWAIRRRCSPGHFRALLDAGVDAKGVSKAGLTPACQALRYGLPEVAAMLDDAGDTDDSEAFIAACARVNRQEAVRILERRPDLPASLSEEQLKMLPELAEAGCADAVRLMVDLGWPITVRGGDWSASALNQAVFRGNAPLAQYLMERGAGWREEHGFGDNVCGTLSWASWNRPVPDGDWAACADALMDHGLPQVSRDPSSPGAVLVGGKRYLFSDEVTDVLLERSEVSTE
jgi:hypothetical protein